MEDGCVGGGVGGGGGVWPWGGGGVGRGGACGWRGAGGGARGRGAGRECRKSRGPTRHGPVSGDAGGMTRPNPSAAGHAVTPLFVALWRHGARVPGGHQALWSLSRSAALRDRSLGVPVSPASVWPLRRRRGSLHKPAMRARARAAEALATWPTGKWSSLNKSAAGGLHARQPCGNRLAAAAYPAPDLGQFRFPQAKPLRVFWRHAHRASHGAARFAFVPQRRGHCKRPWLLRRGPCRGSKTAVRLLHDRSGP